MDQTNDQEDHPWSSFFVSAGFEVSFLMQEAANVGLPEKAFEFGTSIW